MLKMNQMDIHIGNPDNGFVYTSNYRYHTLFSVASVNQLHLKLQLSISSLNKYVVYHMSYSLKLTFWNKPQSKHLSVLTKFTR